MKVFLSLFSLLLLCCCMMTKKSKVVNIEKIDIVYRANKIYPNNSVIKENNIYIIGDIEHNAQTLYTTCIFIGNEMKILETSTDEHFSEVPVNQKDSLFFVSKESGFYYGTIVTNKYTGYFGLNAAKQNQYNVMYLDIDNYPTFLSSKDFGNSWRFIKNMDKLVSADPGDNRTFMIEQKFYVIGSIGGFKKENHFVFICDIEKDSVEKINANKFEGENFSLCILDNKPVIRTDSFDKVNLYDISDIKNIKKETITAPPNRYIIDIYRHKGNTVIVTTPKEIEDSHDVAIYSKQTESADWNLDLSSPYFSAYDFSENLLIGFNLQEDVMYKLRW
jgi:hypothetical protein